jgi:hypothetical protein
VPIRAMRGNYSVFAGQYGAKTAPLRHRPQTPRKVGNLAIWVVETLEKQA